ncbi:hypothetical protein [Mucilaginibacter terrenus]|uniref:hypothetical protein n=1 Tax=Mucilaginibacter terrenus TaxID=2482727 RepID=UPI001058F9FB|nr:hypothetical protein [Mucilaginibacter terrenus]
MRSNLEPASTNTDSVISRTIKVNTVSPGSAVAVAYENGRYIAHLGFGDLDLGNIYFPSGDFIENEAVLQVDNYSAGGPYIAAPYTYLLGNSKIEYSADVKSFEKEWSKFFSGQVSSSVNPYPRPNIDNYVKNYYGQVGVYKGILVRSHSVASTVIIRESTFVPPTASNDYVVLGGIFDPVTNEVWTLYGKGGFIVKAVIYSNTGLIYPISLTGTYSGTQANYHIAGSITRTGYSPFSFDTYVSPM